MKLLLDTHTFLWFLADDPALSSNARTLIEEPENDRWLSLARLWEIAIKASLGKLEIAGSFEEFIVRQFLQNDVAIFEITLTHLEKITTLPFHHRDPFDRLIVAQSLVDRIPIVSVDTKLDEYGVQRLW